MGSVLCFFLFLFLFFGLEFVVASIVATALPSGGASSSGMSLAGTASTASAVSATTFFIFFLFFPPISKGSTTLGRFRTVLEARVSSSALSPPSSPSGWFPSLAAVESNTPFSMFRACFFSPCNFCTRRVCAGAGVSGSGAPTPNLNSQEKKTRRLARTGVSQEQQDKREVRTVVADGKVFAAPPLPRLRARLMRSVSRNSTVARTRRGSVHRPWRGRSELAASPCRCHCWVRPCLHVYHSFGGQI